MHKSSKERGGGGGGGGVVHDRLRGRTGRKKTGEGKNLPFGAVTNKRDPLTTNMIRDIIIQERGQQQLKGLFSGAGIKGGGGKRKT